MNYRVTSLSRAVAARLPLHPQTSVTFTNGKGLEIFEKQCRNSYIIAGAIERGTRDTASGKLASLKESRDREMEPPAASSAGRGTAERIGP